MTGDGDGVPQMVELPTGELIWVRVQQAEGLVGNEPEDDDGAADGTAPDVGGRRKGDGEDQISKLIGFTETVGGIAHSVRNSLAAVRPDRVEVEFGLEIDGSTGKVISLVASAHAKASIKVKLGWEHQATEESAVALGAVPAVEVQAPAPALPAASETEGGTILGTDGVHREP